MRSCVEKSSKRRLVHLWFGMAAGLNALMAHSQVALPNGVPEVPVVDLRVKVLGGVVSVDRQWSGGQWRLNVRWAPAEWSGLPAETGGCRAYPEVKVQGRPYQGDGQAWLLENRYSVRAIEHFAGSDCLANRTKKLKWQDRVTGNWMEYERVDAGTLQFRLARYGDRNDVTVNLAYDAAGQLTEVQDHFKSPVLRYVYTAGQLTEIRDVPTADDPSPARVVKYTWGQTTRAGQAAAVITSVTDVQGQVTQYGINAGKLESITDPEQRVRRFAYTADRVTSYTDGEGKSTNYVYDYNRTTKEFYVRVTAADGSKTEQWYDTDGTVIRRDVDGQTQYKRGAVDTATRSGARSDALGRSIVTTKDEYGNVIKSEYPDGTSTSAKYSAVLGQVTEETDELGIVTRYDYDGKGNLLKKTEAAGRPEQRITDYEYDSYGQVTKRTLRGGTYTLPDGSTYTQPDASQQREYDRFGNVVAVTDALGNVTRTTWNRQGQLLIRTDALGQRWRQEYDAAGRLLVSRNPLDQVTRYVYDLAGNLVRRTDPLGHIWQFGYDKNSRQTTQTNPLGQTNTRQYDDGGRLTGETDLAGNPRYRLVYDRQGRVTESIDAAGNRTLSVWDDASEPAGPVRLETLGLIRRYTYDNRGRIVTTQDSAETLVDGKLQASTGTTRNTWDGKGQLIRTTDKQGNATQLAYDGLGRLIQSTDPLGGITRYTWDSADNLLAVTDATGSTTRYAYDAANRRTKETRSLGQATAYAYDALGQLLSVIDPKGNKIVHRYDAAGRRVGETHTPAGSNSATRTIAYTWNAAGQLTGTTDSNRGHRDHLEYAASYTLDALGRRTSETITLGSTSYTQSTTWHANGQKASQTWPDGDTLTYAWAQGQLQSITFPDNTSLNINERWWNLPKTTLYPGGAIESKTWDGYGRPIGQQLKSPGQTTLLQRSTTYDLGNNPTRIDSEVGQHQYTYDTLYRLTGASHPSGLPTESYTYDGVGNRLTDRNKTNPAQSNGQWRYNANHQLLEAATENTSFLGNNSQTIRYTWDDNGSLIQKATPAGTEDSQPMNNQKYQYDAQNRLTETQDAVGHPIASYQYDPFGRRVRKTVYRTWNNGWQALAEAEVHTYLYTDEGLSAEYLRSGNVDPVQRTSYGWKPDGLWGTDPVWIKTMKEGETEPGYFYTVNDHLGASQQAIDAQGFVVWRMNATAFGETSVDANSVIDNPLRFPGQYYDPETQNYYNYFRDYEPRTGRYAEADPIGLRGGVNYYAYVKNKPLRRVDPLGLITIPDWGTLSPADKNLMAHFYSGNGEYVDISYACSDYLSDSRIDERARELEDEVEKVTESYAGVLHDGEAAAFFLRKQNANYISKIYAFGSGVIHIQTADCKVVGKGCNCAESNCNLMFVGLDEFDDPIDLCEKHGFCGKVRNLGGTPFWFGLKCGYPIAKYACKK